MNILLTPEDVIEAALTATSALERVQILAAAAAGHVNDQDVVDRRCDLVMTVAGFVRHTADTEHDAADVEVLDSELDERELGRQGESRTAVRS